MSEFNKYSTDGGATFIDVEDSKAVHYGDQSKGYVGKNLLNYADPLSSYSWRGVTYTFDKTNRTFTLSGALNADGPTYMTLIDTGTLPAGRYKLSGCPAGGGEYTYCQYIYLTRGSEGIRIKDTGSGIEFDVQDGDTFMFYAPRVDVAYKNQSVNGLVFKPMITRIDVPNSDYAHYEPYLESNNELSSRLTGVYTRFVNIPSNGKVRITASEEYQEFFGLAQRNLSFCFWNYTTSASLDPLSNTTSASMPSVSFVSNKVTDLNNSVTDAYMKILLMSYADFTVS